ncbi:hypothetical protein ABW19_dt0206721 [Dactylella cylindrospora]|nr:hypothetical protein ABW19_dt0206721 [Dactylella cylindrospora]
MVISLSCIAALTIVLVSTTTQDAVLQFSTQRKADLEEARQLWVGSFANDIDPDHFIAHSYWNVTDYEFADPIEKLFMESYSRYREFINRQSKTYDEAVRNYIQRYHREPPAGFEDWFKFAKRKGCLVIDDYDFIHQTMKPYRKIPPLVLLRRIQEVGEIDPRRIKKWKFGQGRYPRIGRDQTHHLLDWTEFVGKLPPMTMLWNGWDEPFVLPMEAERKEKIKFFGGSKYSIWRDVNDVCGWNEGELKTRSQVIEDMRGGSEGQGYVPTFISNITDALDICAHPEYQDQHGFWNLPESFRGIKQLVPIFSLAKNSIFSDLVVPSSDYFKQVYLENHEVKMFDGKIRKLYWRGSTTGGHLDFQNWWNSHRVRFAFLAREHPNLIDAKLTRYVQSDFLAIRALIAEFGQPMLESKSLENDYAYLMDLDGNSFSGRFYRLLRSKAVVFKMTVFQQWHDDRLFPWVHYVPISLGMKETTAVMEYLSQTKRGLEISKRIAEEADWWARKVTRRVDAEVYMYRLLLEYADLFRRRDI